MQKILIINTGGTFSKVYNQFNGKLFVPSNNKTLKEIRKRSKLSNIKIKGLIFKDSLDINKQDRKILVKYIKKSNYKKIIIIHGTDTISKTAKFLDKRIKNREIILTGAMIPFSIDSIEATANFMSAYGFLLNNAKNKIYISMHGLIKKHNKIKKNREKGIFYSF
jgi:L-asparaginase